MTVPTTAQVTLLQEIVKELENVLPNLRPGWRTSEFWLTIFSNLLAIVALVWSFVTHGHHSFGNLQPLVPVAALIAAGVVNFFYAHSRAKVKSAALVALQAAVSHGIL